MTREQRSRQLPVRLPPFIDELLSSWLCRHASFYAVPPLVMQDCNGFAPINRRDVLLTVAAVVPLPRTAGRSFEASCSAGA
jgi:hypothetical protein